MEAHGGDPYPSIMSVCTRQRFQLPTSYPSPPPPPPPSDSQYHLYGPIPLHLLPNYLCLAPKPPLLNSTSPPTDAIHRTCASASASTPEAYPATHATWPPSPEPQVFATDALMADPHPQTAIPITPSVCVVAYQDSPPSVSSVDSEVDHLPPPSSPERISAVRLPELKSLAVSRFPVSCSPEVFSYVKTFRILTFRLNMEPLEVEATSSSSAPKYLTRSRSKLINAIPLDSSVLSVYPKTRKTSSVKRKNPSLDSSSKQQTGFSLRPHSSEVNFIGQDDFLLSRSGEVQQKDGDFRLLLDSAERMLK